MKENQSTAREKWELCQSEVGFWICNENENVIMEQTKVSVTDVDVNKFSVCGLRSIVRLVSWLNKSFTKKSSHQKEWPSIVHE